jgi:2'-5' RNA ligase
VIRTFIAIELPEATREALARVQEQLKQSRAGVRWLNPGAIHLTLKFLGDIDPAQVEDLAAAMAQAVQSEPPLNLSAGGLGAFPNNRNPRVVWIGIIGEVERLVRIQARLEKALAPLGFPREERPFRPHLTLGRVKERRRLRELTEAMASLALPGFNSFDVREIILYKSDLRPTGAIYTKLHHMPLATPATPY